jgi:prepilin-type N-terminal cleavage/methylation domain-containing protein
MNRRNDRYGFSLLEVTFAMAISSVLMVVTVIWIHESLEFGSWIKQRQQLHNDLTRLAWKLRNDIHHASSMSLVGDRQLVLDQTDSTTTYTIAETSLVVARKPRAGESLPASRETFALSEQVTISWDGSQLPKAIALLVRRRDRQLPDLPSTKAETLPTELSVKASVNRWQEKARPIKFSMPTNGDSP